MSAALVRHEESLSTALEERQDLLRATIAKDCRTDAEFDVFLMACKRLQLDPFANQISPVKLGGKMTIQVRIDGFRAIAERTGEYEGRTPIQWTADGETWVDVWANKESPLAARVGVYRKGFREAVYAVALTADYKGGGPWWNKSGGAHQIGKCAEALALRTAFPACLGGVYTTDEMEHVGGARVVAADPEAPEAEIESVEEAPLKKPPAWIRSAQERFRALKKDHAVADIFAALSESLAAEKLWQPETEKDLGFWVISKIPTMTYEQTRRVYAATKKGLTK